MKTSIDWDTLGVLFAEEGIAVKENKIYTLLMTGGFLPDSAYNTLAVYNHDYSIITDLDDWEQLAKVCKSNNPNGFNNWHKNKGIEYLLKYAKEKPFVKDILMKLEESPTNYLGFLSINHFSDLFLNYVLSLDSFSEEDDLKILRLGLKYNFCHKNQLLKIDERIRQKVLFDIAKDPEIVHQLNYILPLLEIESEEQWREIFNSKKIYEPQFFTYACQYSFYQAIAYKAFKSIANAKGSLDKTNANEAYSYASILVADAYSKKKTLEPLVFEALKKLHPYITVWQNEIILHDLYKNSKVSSSKDFEEYIKHLVAEETRAGVLKYLANILPKKQLPWLLSSDFKTVKNAVKKKLKV